MVRCTHPTGDLSGSVLTLNPQPLNPSTLIMASYPIDLDLSGWPVLVVGLGAVGRRKAEGLGAAGARVIGVDPNPEAGRRARARASARGFAIEVHAEPYGAAHLEGVRLAFATASAAVNRQVVADARKAGIWVCSASESSEGNFTVPAIWRDGPLTLTVATTGASPALAAALRDRAARALGPAAAGLATSLAELRPAVLARLSDPEARRRLLREWADPRWLDLWHAEGPEAVRRALVRALDDAVTQQRPGSGHTRPCQESGPD
jgi:precorrin-2 dehydrogenase/sirohydrochlorin ferrochelatase